MKKMLNILRIMCAVILIALVIPSTTVMAATKNATKAVVLGQLKYDYGYIGNFKNGLAVVEKNGKYGYINTKGKEIIKCSYDAASDFDGKKARVYKDDKCFFINKNGKKLTKEYLYIGQFDEKEKLYVVKEEIGKDEYGDLISRFGFINESFNVVIPSQYLSAEDFSEGLAYVRKDDDHWGEGFIDKSGNEVIPCVYKWASSFGEGVAFVIDSEGNSALIDKTGKRLVEFGKKYDMGEVCSGGLIPVRNIDTQKWGCIDKNGAEVIPCNYTLIGKNDIFVGDQNVLVKIDVNRKCGLVDKTGKEVVECKYSNIREFDKGYYEVHQGFDKGIINELGEQIVPCKYHGIEMWGDNLFKVQASNGSGGLYDKNGKVVLECKYYFGKLENGKAAVSEIGKGTIGFISKTGKITRKKNAFVPSKDGFEMQVKAVKGQIKYGLINNKKKEILKCQYDELLVYGKNIVIAKKGNKRYLIKVS